MKRCVCLMNEMCDKLYYIYLLCVFVCLPLYEDVFGVYTFMIYVCFYVIKIQKNEEEELMVFLWPHELIA